MPKLHEVCRHIRSKNAGPFWITVDLSFDSTESFERYGQSPSIGATAFAGLVGAEPHFISIFPVPNLNVVKISYPRQKPQGWSGERDMHSGQQYVRLLNIELD